MLKTVTNENILDVDIVRFGDHRPDCLSYILSSQHLVSVLPENMIKLILTLRRLSRFVIKLLTNDSNLRQMRLMTTSTSSNMFKVTSHHPDQNQSPSSQSWQCHLSEYHPDPRYQPSLAECWPLSLRSLSTPSWNIIWKLFCFGVTFLKASEAPAQKNFVPV